MYSNRNQRPVSRTIGGLLEDLFQGGLGHFLDTDMEGNVQSGQVPVNIREIEKAYEIQVIAPGIPKEEFRIDVDKNILTISYEHREEQKEETDKWLRKEYLARTFKRNFTLNEKIDLASVSAAYTNGILTVTLPKKEITTQPVQSIPVQ